MKIFILTLSLILLCAVSALSADYHGQNLDGKKLGATVYSYDAAKYYDVIVIFDGDECDIKFDNGGKLTVTLDDGEIDDPHGIAAYDYDKAAFWDIDLTDFD